MFSWGARLVVNYFIERNVQRRRPTEIAMSVFRLQERIESPPSNEVIRRASIYGLEKD
jgi:hypothetical protein